MTSPRLSFSYQRHFQVSKDYKSLLWLPSKKKDSEFGTLPVLLPFFWVKCAYTCPLVFSPAVNFDNVEQVVIGTESPALAKLNTTSKVLAEFYSRSPSTMTSSSAYSLSGFLQKKGGSKGGRRNWTQVRVETPACFALLSACLNPISGICCSAFVFSECSMWILCVSYSCSRLCVFASRRVLLLLLPALARAERECDPILQESEGHFTEGLVHHHRRYGSTCP